MQTVLLVVGATLGYGIYFYVSSLLHSIAEAKRSGFNYVVVRTYHPRPLPGLRRECANTAEPRAAASPIALPWQLTHRIWMRIIMLFPESWWEEWLEYGPPGACSSRIDVVDT